MQAYNSISVYRVNGCLAGHVWLFCSRDSIEEAASFPSDVLDVVKETLYSPS